MSASNSVHYLYNVAAPHAGPQACLTGHTTDSFYIKTAFSPTGDHVLSGSSDGHACIWPVRSPTGLFRPLLPIWGIRRLSTVTNVVGWLPAARGMPASGRCVPCLGSQWWVSDGAWEGGVAHVLGLYLADCSTTCAAVMLYMLWSLLTWSGS